MKDEEVSLELMQKGLQKSWGLEFIGDEIDENAVKILLQNHLQELLASDFERLVQAMYRLDVAETKFAAAISAGSLESQAQKLAELVWQRELQRIAFRLRYQQQTKPS